MWSRTVPSRRELVAWALAIGLTVSTVAALRSDQAADAAGSGPATGVVYLATGANFPDALGAAATAAIGLGPVLLVKQNEIPTRTMEELYRLTPPTIYVVGGTAVISSGVEATLGALPWSPAVVRIGGSDRYDTAADLSEAQFPTTGLYPRAALVKAEGGLVGTSSGTVTLLALTIEAPAPGILIVNAGADFLATSGTLGVNCWIDVGAATVPGSSRELDLDSTNIADGICTTQAALIVDDGTHTVEFEAQYFTTGSAYSRTLTAVWYPFDGEGAVPIPVP